MTMGSTRASMNEGDRVEHVPLRWDIDRVMTDLGGRFPAVSPEVLQTVVAEEFGKFDGAAITTFVPVLVAKAATVRLTRNGRDLRSTPVAGRPDEGLSRSACTGWPGESAGDRSGR